jgi:hypothetical protein
MRSGGKQAVGAVLSYPPLSHLLSDPTPTYELPKSWKLIKEMPQTKLVNS